MQRPDQQHRTAVLPRGAHHLQKRGARRVAHVDTGAELLGPRDVTQHHPHPSSAGSGQQRGRVGVELPAHAHRPHHVTAAHQVIALGPIGRGLRPRLLRSTLQPCPHRGHLIGIRARGPLPVQQSIHDFEHPVVVPPHRSTVRGEDLPGVAPQRRPVDHHHLDPVQPAQRPRVQHNHPTPGQTASQHRGEQFPTELGRLRDPRQDGVGDVRAAP